MTEKVSRPSTIATAPPPATPVVVGEVVPRPVYVGKLESVSDWRRQLGKIYREMRRGELRPEDGTKLAFVANLGAQLSRLEEELKEARALREEIERLQDRGASASGFDRPAIEQQATEVADL